jgi:hypothetical protein
MAILYRKGARVNTGFRYIERPICAFRCDMTFHNLYKTFIVVIHTIDESNPPFERLL